jgi:hypothetical protein
MAARRAAGRESGDIAYNSSVAAISNRFGMPATSAAASDLNSRLRTFASYSRSSFCARLDTLPAVAPLCSAGRF